MAIKAVPVEHYDAFSSIPHMGNPAGIVLEGESLTEEQMQEIARVVDFNETAFLLASDQADFRIRYFTPGHEINLCGHATMAMIYAMKTRGMLEGKTEWTIETKAGVLPIKLDRKKEIFITMRQAAPQFASFHGSRKQLAESIGLDEDSLVTELPIVYGSTGTWTLLVPVRSLAVMERMDPQSKLFPAILSEMPTASIHPFCLETLDSAANMHARHFSSPYSGTTEDPVTGTASGVMGAYYATYIQDAPVLELLIEQGQELGKDGRVQVTVTNGEQIEITGTAVYVKSFEVSI